MLTNWGEELYRLDLNTCSAVFNRQRVCGKMLLYYEFKIFIANAVTRKQSAHVGQPVFNKFERKVRIILGFGLIRDEDDYSTEEYYSDEEYERAPDSTLDELCF